MTVPHLTPIIQPQPLSCSSRVYLWPRPYTAMDHSVPHTVTMRFCYSEAPGRCLSTAFVPPSSAIRLHRIEAVPTATEARESLNLNVSSKFLWDLNSPGKETGGEAMGFTCDSEHEVTCNIEELKEIQRRRRIGLANKGKVPWNKGKKHSLETCARIKERTISAMRDPKVRKKMSETPHLHSEESKEKISASLKRLWAERLKRKRVGERFYFSWAESIADAARRGGINEEELTWDSYERLKGEIALQHLHWAAAKAEDRKLKKNKAERRTRKREEKMAWHAQKKVEQKLKFKPKSKRKGRVSYKARKAKEALDLSEELNPSDRLKKILSKRLIDGPSSSQAGVMTFLQSALESFDIESIRREQLRNTVSLADQIQAAKRKRMQVVSGGSAVAA